MCAVLRTSRSRRWRAFALFLLSFFAVAAAYAAAPQKIMYQGTLRRSGSPYTGNVTFVFRLTNQGGGAEYWTSGSTVVAVTGGLFRYPLGETNTGGDGGFPSIDWANITPYIEVTADTVTLLPREPLASVPYALSGSGDNLGNHTATAVLQMGAYGVNTSSNITAARYQINGSTVLAILPGSDSLGIGVNAGGLNTANNNAYVGYYSGYNNITGSGNSILGTSAGFGGGSFSSSTLVGYQAGYSLDTGGSDNIFLGWQAGYSVTTGTGNIIIGYNKNASAAGASNELNIGGLLFGDLAAKTIGISTRAPQAALDIVSTGTLINQYAQIWRASNGTIVSSMTSTGVLYPAVPAADNTKVAKAGDTMTGQLTLSGSTLTVIAPDALASSLWVSTSASTPHLYVSTNGRVGLGLANPVEKLEVNGAVRVTNQAAQADGSAAFLDYNPSLGEQRFFVLGKDAATRGSFLFASRESDQGNQLLPLEIKNNGNIILAQTAGNVGIGNTSPPARLAVNAGGAAQTSLLSSEDFALYGDNSGEAALSRASSDATGPRLFFYKARGSHGSKGAPTTDDEVGSIYWRGAINGASYGGVAGIAAFAEGPYAASDTPGRLAFMTTPDNSATLVTRMTIRESGNVGIGTTVPGAKLHAVETSGSSSYIFATSTATDSGSYKMVVSTTGNVGIGTTGPGYKLTVSPASAYTALNTGDGFQVSGSGIASGANMIFGISGTTGNTIQSRDGTAATWPLLLNPFGGNVGIGTNSPTGKIHVSTGIGATSLFVSGSGSTAGNVGIGTTGPMAKLEIGAGGNIKLQDQQAIVWGAGAGGTDFQTGNGTTHKLTWYTDSTARMIIDNLGNVGIGTTGPGAKFEVVGGSVTFRGSDSNSAIAGFTDAGGNYRVVISTAGNVGIGTTAPANRLHVRSTNGVNTLLENDGTGNMVLEIKSAQNTYRSINFLDSTGSAVSQIGVAGTAGTSTMTFTTTAIERMRIDNQGNVGIGTTNPAGRLHVSGGDLQVGDAAASTVSASGYMTFANISAPSAAKGRVYYDSSANALKLSTGTDSASWVAVAPRTFYKTTATDNGIAPGAQCAANFHLCKGWELMEGRTWNRMDAATIFDGVSAWVEPEGAVTVNNCTGWTSSSGGVSGTVCDLPLNLGGGAGDKLGPYCNTDTCDASNQVWCCSD